MDGGKNDGSGDVVEDVIHRSMTLIDRQLGNNWQFHAWVVTHWDEDHYEGTLKFVKNYNQQRIKECGRAYFQIKPILFCGAPLGCDNLGPPDKVQEAIRDSFPQVIIKSAKDLLGVDLFTADQVLDKKTWQVNKNGVQPRFCCLAAGGWGIGWTGNSGSKEEYGAKDKNETSILSLLFWPESRRSSYFTGGDGHPKLSNDLVLKYMENSRLLDQTLAVIKLDHHGSSNEWAGTKKYSGQTPCWNMTMATKARKVIVTPGESYGHPGK